MEKEAPKRKMDLPKVKLLLFTCQVCGTTSVKHKKNDRFCSIACRQFYKEMEDIHRKDLDSEKTIREFYAENLKQLKRWNLIQSLMIALLVFSTAYFIISIVDNYIVK